MKKRAKNNSKNKIYESVKGLTEVLSEAGLYNEEEISTEGELKEIKATIKIHSWIIIGVFVVVAVAFLGFVFDAIYFHITNNEAYRSSNGQYGELQKSINEYTILNYEKLNEIKKEVNSLKIKNTHLK